MSVLYRSALGRIESLGFLYDARTDSFTGESILKSSSIPSEAGIVEETDISHTDISRTLSRNLNDRFNQLDIKGELKLSVLCGLVEVKGSAKYLTEESDNQRLLCSSLTYKTKTKQQKLDWANEKAVLDYINLQIIKDPGYATHFVSEIEWGFNITISAKTEVNNKKSDETLGGEVNAQFERLKVISTNGKIDLKKLKKLKNDDESFDFRIYGDIEFPANLAMPGTFEEAKLFIEKAPSFLPKTNEGKGVPLFYTLQPLSSAHKLYHVQSNLDNVYKAITDHAVAQCFQIFEEYATAKQKITEAERELDENMNIVSPRMSEAIRELKRRLVLREAAYKSELWEKLMVVRSGEQNASVLQTFLQQFLKTHEMDSPEAVVNGLSIFDGFKEKIALVESLKAEGVTYVGAGGSLSLTIRKECRRRNIYILNYFDSMEKKEEALECFQSLKKEKIGESDSLFIFADRELNLDQPAGKQAITVSRYVTGRIATENLIPEMLEKIETDLATNDNVEPTLEKTCILVMAKLPCPGYFTRRGCSAEPRTFKCTTCREKLNFYFQEYKLSCKCGVFSPSTTRFKCIDSCHGDDYVQFPDQKSLKGFLKKLRPKEFNILVLGETGVGKSTWINGMLNYATHDKLEDALEDSDTKCFIPLKFTIADPKKGISKTVYLGTPNRNESEEQGQSATQMPRTYSFVMDEAIIRLIDTPGIGDTRGYDQDKINVENILGYLDQYDDIHGITILMKPNDSKLNYLFNFCLKELLRHLHKDATKNIMFVFTNARATFYKPGDTYKTLQTLLEGNPAIGIKLSYENTYCMDNEAVRFLAACKCDVEFSEDEKKDFSKSWDKSYEETLRLIEHVRFLRPHGTRATVILNKVRRQIAALARPLSLITENINHNIQACLDQTRDIEEREKKKKGLEDVLFVPFIDLKQVPLGFPRTVCTSSKCVDVRVLHGQNVNHYKTICHNHCYLGGVPLNAFPEPRLRQCAAMKSGFLSSFHSSDQVNCVRCGCNWSVHMHITYSHESVETIVENETTKDKILKEEVGIQKAQTVKQILTRRVDEYRKEERDLLEASAEFGSFLKNYAILPYNDALKEYLKHMINEEQKKQKNVGIKNTKLERLEQWVKDYDEEVKMLETAMKMGTKSPKTPEEIQALIEKICNLKHFGSKVKDGLEANTNGRLMELQKMEVATRIDPTETRGGLFRKVGGIVKGAGMKVYSKGRSALEYVKNL